MNDVRLGSAQDCGGSTGEVGEGQARKERVLKETEPHIQSPALSLIHPQLKIGTANQRHPFSPAAILLSTIQQRK
jgi:hypothetical protein